MKENNFKKGDLVYINQIKQVEGQECSNYSSLDKLEINSPYRITLSEGNWIELENKKYWHHFSKFLIYQGSKELIYSLF